MLLKLCVPDLHCDGGQLPLNKQPQAMLSAYLPNLLFLRQGYALKVFTKNCLVLCNNDCCVACKTVTSPIRHSGVSRSCQASCQSQSWRSTRAPQATLDRISSYWGLCHSAVQQSWVLMPCNCSSTGSGPTADSHLHHPWKQPKAHFNT